MSSSPIPKTAPFAEEEIELLNRVVGPASATQRAWLAGFLAGIEVTGDTAVAALAPAPATEVRPAEPLTILYATESGNPRSSPATSPRPRARTASSPPSSTWRTSIWQQSHLASGWS
jgi:hypothetical protein